MNAGLPILFALRPSWVKKIEVTRVANCPVPGDCWLWRGALANGYGIATVNCRVRRTHRFAYEVLVGPIPAGLQLDHLCRQPACCAPHHLEPVTPKVNSERGLRGPVMLTHCPSGHEYAGQNLYLRTDAKGFTRRSCKTCRDAHAARHKAKRNARREQTWAKYAAYLPSQLEDEAAS